MSFNGKNKTYMIQWASKNKSLNASAPVIAFTKHEYIVWWTVVPVTRSSRRANNYHSPSADRSASHCLRPAHVPTQRSYFVFRTLDVRTIDCCSSVFRGKNLFLERERLVSIEFERRAAARSVTEWAPPRGSPDRTAVRAFSTISRHATRQRGLQT